MSCEGSSPDMDDRRNPPSLVDESSITIRLPTGSMSSCSEDRSSPCKAPSLSSQSDIYALSDKEDYQSDKDESTHQYQEDAKRDEDVRPKKFCNGEHIILARRDDDTCTHRPEYFRSSETIRQFQKNMDHNEGNNTNPLSGDDYFKPMNKPRKLKKGVIHDEENSSTPPPDEEYFRPIKKLRMVEIRQQEMVPSPPKPLTSFFIKDILNHKPTLPRRHSTSSERAFVRPWDLGCQGPTAASSRRRPRSADDDSRSEKSETDSSGSPGGIPINASPLDALFEMTSKAFEGLDADEKSQDPTRDHLSLFSNRVQPKKKRKSRTAFTNHQIFELEKRFLYQKYLSPADRDEIAQSLGLTNAQVITWFQNRRAKLKRDMEELKKDVDAAKVTTHRTILSSYHDVAKQNLSTDTDS